MYKKKERKDLFWRVVLWVPVCFQVERAEATCLIC